MNAEKHLNLNNKISSDPSLALQMQTRAANIHESLHIIYSNFSDKFFTDIRASSEIRTLILSNIRNIIEDAFIEAAGCSLYDNLEHYLLWNRIALFYSTVDLPDTLEQCFEKVGIKIDTRDAYEKIETRNGDDRCITDDDNTKFAKLIIYMNYMGLLVLYPFYKLPKAPKLVFEYVEKTESIFSKAVLCGNANERDKYVFQIFDIIEPLLPDDNNLNLLDSVKYLLDDLRDKTNNNTSINSKSSNGKEVEVTRRLFTDRNNKPVSFRFSKEKLENDMRLFLLEREMLRSKQKNEQSITIFNYDSFDCSNLHKNILIEVIKPKINEQPQGRALRYRQYVSLYVCVT